MECHKRELDDPEIQTALANEYPTIPLGCGDFLPESTIFHVAT